MRFAAVVWLLALGACGPSVGSSVEHPKDPVPTVHLQGYDVPDAGASYQLAADDHALYWLKDGVWRRPHGVDGKPEHLYATDDEIDYLSVGPKDVFVVGIDYKVRAIPLAGGVPAELGEVQASSIWALAADDDAVWVGVDDRLERFGRDGRRKTVQLPHAGTFVTIARGVAFVTGADAPTLARVDLATGMVKPMSNDWWYGSAYGLAVAGDSLLCAYSEGVAAIPTAGGKSQLTFATPVYAMAGDGDGYVVQESNAIVEHHRGSAPRVIGTSDMMTSFGGNASMAVGGGYAYVFTYDSTKGTDVIVRAYPRDGGVEMLRYPIDGNITDLGVDGTTAVIGLEDADGEHLARVDARRSKRVFHAQSYIDTVVTGDGETAFGSNGEIYALAKGGQRARRLTTSDIGALPLAVHKQLVYYALYGSIYAVPVAGGATVKVFDGTSLQDVGEYATIASIEFGNDHLYFTVTYGGTLGLYSIDEKRTPKLVWSYPLDGADGNGFFPEFAVIGATAYVHDYTRIWAIDLDDGSAKVAWQHDDAQLSWLDAVGPHVVAWTGGPDGNELIEVMPKSGKTHVLWRSYLDGGYSSFMAAGDDGVYIASPELYAILKIPVD